jgi:hypothetical protein
LHSFGFKVRKRKVPARIKARDILEDVRVMVRGVRFDVERHIKALKLHFSPSTKQVRYNRKKSLSI